MYFNILCDVMTMILMCLCLWYLNTEVMTEILLMQIQYDYNTANG